MAKIKVASCYLLLAALALLIVSEFLLRFVVGLGSPLLYVEDPLVGYQVKPDQHLQRFGKDAAINRYGMRSDEIPLRPQSGSYPILVLGDSVTFGTNQLAQSEIFTSRMNGQHVGKGCTLEVMNASASGWAIANELAYLQKYKALRPELVILVLNDHDLNQPFATLPKTPDFPKSDPIFALQEAIVRYAIPRLFRKSAVDPGAAIMEISPDLNRQRLGRNFRDIRRIGEFSRQRAGQFLLVLVPSARQLYEHNPVLIANTELFYAEFRHENLLDLRPLFGKADRASLYIDKIHLKPAAHRIIANVLLRKLSKDIPECPSHIAASSASRHGQARR